MFASQGEEEKTVYYTCSICKKVLPISEGRYICENLAVCPSCHSDHGSLRVFRLLEIKQEHQDN